MPRAFGGLPPDDPGRPEGATGPRPVGRVVRLFRPYRKPLLALLGLILVSAGLGVVSPFLLRAVLDTAIPEKDTRLLTALVAGGGAPPLLPRAPGHRATGPFNTVGHQGT